eukprot:Phypoly_transcript_13707.p1 GENE.Phypoly_transcript_13707~~Phypoly_transcript_13707.p1  ORF type:complete len:195 (+),score=17.31 Phypoly_transcript_13707:92-676(+)
MGCSASVQPGMTREQQQALSSQEAREDALADSWELRIKSLPLQTAWLTDAQKKSILDLWPFIERQLDPASEVFYMKLFKVYPGCKDYFSTSGNYGKMILMMMKMCVQKINDIDLFTNSVIDLGARHAKYRIRGRRDLSIGGECFLFTVKLICNDRFDSLAEDAFVRMYAKVEELMMVGYDRAKNFMGQSSHNNT